MSVYPKKCDKCGKGMFEGYAFGCVVFCSDACAFSKDYTKEMYLKDYSDDSDSAYWTEWEIEDEAFNELGVLIIDY